MGSTAVEIIDGAVTSIVGAMAQGKFSKEELEVVKKIFEAGIESTEKCLDRGPSSESA